MQNEAITSYDVIIVGAGIAGISSAIHLKKLNKNLKVLVIEKAQFPRAKLCAGYLTKKSTILLDELGLDTKTIKYELVKGLTVYYKHKKRFSLSNHGLYCQELVNRSVLDNELFNVLKKEDVTILENSTIDALDENKNQIIINKNIFNYNNLIFADGELGYSSKFNKKQKRYFAMQENIMIPTKAQINMYFNIAKKGYAWYSSSGNYINIGFCDIYNPKTDYTKLFNDFKSNLGIEEQGNLKGFFVPYGIKKNKIINNNIYLTGDAAGLVDPLTLAGISYAILSGKFVAKSIVSNSKKAYFEYLNKTNFKFSILKIMHKLLYNKFFLFLIIRVAGRLCGNLFVYILDKFILNKKDSFHE
ncbi:MAG: NAD(P)/FAD-dependent oxidoreductase [Lachnospiraceae bacterium]|nr:NAD(P)/FAD-dependent oxidoreductase [Lachnospiraceae bacterium]